MDTVLATRRTRAERQRQAMPNHRAIARKMDLNSVCIVYTLFEAHGAAVLYYVDGTMWLPECSSLGPATPSTDMGSSARPHGRPSLTGDPGLEAGFGSIILEAVGSKLFF